MPKSLFHVLLSGQAMLFIVKQGGDKDQSSSLRTIWGLNYCFHIISQCIQAVNPSWYSLGPLLTLVNWSLSWSDILANIDRNTFLTLSSLAGQQPWKKRLMWKRIACLFLSVLQNDTSTPTPSSSITVDAMLVALVWGILLDHSL